MERLSIPVLDLFGNGGNRKDSNHARSREPLASKSYQQIKIEITDHKFTNHEQQMIDTVTAWLKAQH